MIWVIIIASVGGLLLLAIARAPHEDPPPSGNASTAETARGAAEKYDKELEEKYFQSPLTKRIIASISDGTGRLPEQIDVHADRVTGRTEGAVRAFDFLTERVPKLEKKSFAYKDTVFDGGDYHTFYEYLSPEEALATAINRILGGEYDMKWVYRGSYPHVERPRCAYAESDNRFLIKED